MKTNGICIITFPEGGTSQISNLLQIGDILPAMNGGASHEGEGWQNPFNVV